MTQGSRKKDFRVRVGAAVRSVAFVMNGGIVYKNAAPARSLLMWAPSLDFVFEVLNRTNWLGWRVSVLTAREGEVAYRKIAEKNPFTLPKNPRRSGFGFASGGGA